MSNPQIAIRDVPPRAVWALEQAGVHPLLARLFAARGIRSADELDDGLARLLPPDALLGAREAAVLLADTLQAGQRLVVVADYDCDGATACAVALRGLAMLGARPGTLQQIVPDRAVHGYGLTPTIVDLALDRPEADRPQLLITVDNGIASQAGVAHARSRGLRVLVTDHHLPACDASGGVVLPEADVIVNPNQPGCGFASKAIAGVGVMFYVLLATRAELRHRGAFDAASQPRLDALLDLVALGTVADVVRLDANNRRLVAQGLKRIRAGRMQAGVAALFAAAGRDPSRASAADFGFALGPRLNAAGRLADMSLGIACLLCDEPRRAAELAQALDAINRERREVESGMKDQAERLLERLMPRGEAPPALVLFDEDFHEGVVGIVAGRLKERLHRPTFVFARGGDGLLKGSGRSIPGFHLRDALDLVAKREPELLRKFGGHAMAAGCTLSADGIERFAAALQQVAAEWLDAAALQRRLATDGPLDAAAFEPALVRLLDAEVWGQAFEAPLFTDEVDVVQQRLVGEKHLKLSVRHAGTLRDAIWFGHTDALPNRVRLAYRLNIDEYQGRQRVQMVVEAAIAVGIA
ncbi:single-stranded-DNA-specific exonuclease RecJ [Leptothrix discophora]|uniref:Single-stranded-DNA-specific exonuclease RecJ n=1 Tax=Leptothrix discophora TaxID=89 RepID=A0ABT9G1Z7_LEPDI|nr:single-stranded-DNA-specific exonuclease RecJ [Leptothrix discophora]MDP4300515.1 single-stranded-DNA-specific exonuclease RecJ [Leptothrix discophora]